MATDIHKLIATINPDIYCDKSVREEVKKIVKEEGYLKATEKAKTLEFKYMDFDKDELLSPFKKAGQKNPIEKYQLEYEATSNGLESIYFWIIDKIETEGEYEKSEKLIDNFISSPGSAHFSEMGGKLTRMQEEASKWLGAANNVIKSILNLIYDLKDFKIRLGVYDKLKSKEERENGMLALKQIWLDKVDIQKGTSSIKALSASGANQPNFITLIDAFMTTENEKLEDKNGKELDLNDRVKRIIKQRITEFYLWLKESEKELRKRYEIERKYLESQYNTLKLYARWAKPYLKSAKLLEQNASPTSSLVTAFNTTLFELSVLAEKEYKPEGEIARGILPKIYKKIKTRKYYQVLIIDFNFRSIPEKVGQNYGFRGKVDLVFTSYGLNEDELKILKQEITKDDVDDVFKLITGATEASLGSLKDDIDELLGEKTKEEEKKEEKKDINPFSALFSGFGNLFSLNKKEEKVDLSKGIPKDSDFEVPVRSITIIESRKRCNKMYGLYKKANEMPGF